MKQNTIPDSGSISQIIKYQEVFCTGDSKMVSIDIFIKMDMGAPVTPNLAS
jgi:hypothetical protein